MPHQRRPTLGLGLLLLGNRLFSTGIQHIPPVTLLCILLQAALYMGFISPPWDRYDVCLSAEAVLYYKDYQRLFLSAIEHADDWHLYHNMASLILKGRTLETLLGSGKFTVLLLSFIFSTSLVYVGLAKMAYSISEDYSYMKQCAIGFSGVLFAMKVLTTYYSGERKHFIHGFFVPSKYAVWVELLLIHILVPRASFLGHLAGIVVGILYIKGPLYIIVEAVCNLIYGNVGGRWNYDSRSYTYASGTAARGNFSSHVEETGYGWDVDSNNHYDDGSPLSTEELRRRRLNRLYNR